MQDDVKKTCEQRYRERHGYKIKGFQINHDLEKTFIKECENKGFGQSEAICALIEMFIDGNVTIPTTERQLKLMDKAKKISIYKECDEKMFLKK
jgi:hypothetical protein